MVIYSVMLRLTPTKEYRLLSMALHPQPLELSSLHLKEREECSEQRTSVSLMREISHLHILAEKEWAHVRWGGGSMWFQQLAGSHRLLIILLALPIFQQ